MNWVLLGSLLSCLFLDASSALIAPKVMILSMFTSEANVWYGIPEFNLMEQNITVLGLSPRFPQVHCTGDGVVCQLTLGEGEINAASSIAALVFSPLTDLTSTYILIAGIAGVNPKVATIGSVTFARYAVQVALQMEIDAREIPENFSTGYFPQDSSGPGQFPGTFYGTEVFEVNDALRQLAFNAAQTAQLNDTEAAIQLRAQYAESPIFAPANNVSGPSVTLCDTATSDNFWDGTLLGETFENTTKVFTNQTGVYCTTQQEDNATLGALLRGAMSGLVDFSRIIVMRTTSDFDRPGPGETVLQQVLGPSPGHIPAEVNLHLAGVEVVDMIVKGWSATFENGVPPTNYIGDVFGSLGGNPDFGPGSIFGGKPAGDEGTVSPPNILASSYFTV
ncbi:Purine nucleoside permease [Mycena sanguinolenta]|uniref:Purine nucleoside permease n=1 Tax=Mycena sanguinolenta TaxID=230812 RepID=A0A8H6Z7H9_9AGAR|nr:Purine nucleoside permease [Mycena sanguinolenta]